jgi:hypothetical protein
MSKQATPTVTFAFTAPGVPAAADSITIQLS